MSDGMLARVAARDSARVDDVEFADLISDHLRYTLCKEPTSADAPDILLAVCMALRRRLTDAMLETQRRRVIERPKRIYYLSMEFMVGQSLVSTALNLDMLEPCRDAVTALGFDFDSVASLEPEAVAGAGGIGRLAACFIDSMATLGLAGVGCGVRNDLGIFKQEIVSFQQPDKSDKWSAHGSPWLIERGSQAHEIPLYGRIVDSQAGDGRYDSVWLNCESITGVPYDMPIPGYGGRTVNHLRLYAAQPSVSLDTEVLASSDPRELRFIKDYFLIACAIRDMMRNFLAQNVPLTELASCAAVQINDSHASLAVAELMRLLVDEHAAPWEEAWYLTQQTLAYTSHTLMDHGLEHWPVEMIRRVLPRHLQIICEINRRFLAQVRLSGASDPDMLRRLSIIDEGAEKQVRTVNLAIVGCHSVNGVSLEQSRRMTTELAPDFYDLFPGRFNNKTNGVTPRRWLLQVNPLLAALLTETVGTGWITDMTRLRALESLAQDHAFNDRIAQVKLANKEHLARYVYAEQGVKLDPGSIFDVQLGSVHESRRQLLHALHIIHLYLGLVEHSANPPPRTHVFSGGASSGCGMATLIIELINRVAEVIRADPRARSRLSVIFIPDYRVSVAQRVIPAADLSEQISTVGMEACGTANMKFAMNGAITVGTYDGANIEMAQEIGADNLHLFGRTAAGPSELRAGGARGPGAGIDSDSELRRVVDSLVSGRFSKDLRTFRTLHDALLDDDPCLVLADFAAYATEHRSAAVAFMDRRHWFERTIYNIARSGRFSSDRTVAEYARHIWRV